MKKQPPTILKKIVDTRLLPFVRKPSRYIGGEINQIKKDLTSCPVKVALCFPDVYEIAASHTGLAIIYEVLNRLDYAAAERCFAPWLDAEEIMRKNSIPLFTLESKADVKDFDIIAFGLTNELCYTNVLNMLDLAGLSIRVKDRAESDPFVIAGAQAANCAEPVAPFIDLFVLGDGEYTAPELVGLIKEYKDKNAAKSEILLAAAQKFSFVYVPSLYEFSYNPNGSIEAFKPKKPNLPLRFENAVVQDLDSAPVPAKPLVPFTQAVHERVSVEIMRGCPGRCRFCQASFCKRPLRFRSVNKILEIAKTQYHATGFDTVGLLSLSSADYPHLEQLVTKLQDYFQPRHVGLSLPSIRVREHLKILPKLMTSVRKSGLTIAVEAASENLRKIINKPITDADLLDGIHAAYKAGFKKLKLYFMVGLPGETENDIEKIITLSDDIARLKKQIDGRNADVNITISFLVPKPHTPLQWLAQKPKEYFENAKKLIIDNKRRLRAKYLHFKFHNIERSVLESAIARTDRRTADIIETAWQNGAKFDLWDECFNNQVWADAFRAHGQDINQAAQKTLDTSDTLPWQYLGGPDKKSLLKHYTEVLRALEKK